ncbi:MAG: RNA recognition motif domain-containing protein [Elusimicrobiota bacterium]
MTTNLFVGGLSYETTQEELEKMFASCGKVAHVKLIMDRETSRSKGFGFVEMATEAEAAAALKKLGGAMLNGKKIFVNEARPKEERPDAAPSKPAFVPGPGFVERRSGKDRRQAGGFGAPKAFGEKPAERRVSFGEKPRWADKPKWGDKPGGFAPRKFGDKPGGFGPKKFGDKPKWGDKPGGFGPKKFGDKPKWGDKPGGFGPKKFGDKPAGFGPKKFGDKPRGFGPKKFGKPGGFRGKRD